MATIRSCLFKLLSCDQLTIPGYLIGKRLIYRQLCSTACL